MWAFQRITGLVILGFLVWHIYTLSAILTSGEVFDQAMKNFQTPLIKAGELLLVWVVLFHALNGLRLILFNLFPRIQHKRLAYYASAISLVITICSIPLFF